MAATSAVVLNGQIGFPSGRQLIAASGRYFTITNPTIGTPVAYAQQVAWSATANGMFALANTAGTGGPNIILDRLFLRLRATAPATTLTMQFEAYNETGAVTLTGNVTTRTPVQMNTALAQTSVATAQAFATGAATVPAAVGTRRLQDVASITTGVAVDGDTYILQFGADGALPWKNGGAAARASDPAMVAGSMGPIIVAPGTTTWLNMWWLTGTTNVASFEYGLSWMEL